METLPSTDIRAESDVPKSEFGKEKSSHTQTKEYEGSHDKQSASPVANGKSDAKEDSFSLHGMAVSPQGESLNQKPELKAPESVPPSSAEKVVGEPEVTSKEQNTEIDRAGLSENEGGRVLDSTERELTGPSAPVTEDISQKAQQTKDAEPSDGGNEKTVNFVESEEIIPRSDGLDVSTGLDKGTTSTPLEQKMPETSAAGTSTNAGANPNLVSPLPQAKKSVLNKVPTMRTSEEQLKSKVVIPSYLSEGIVKAIASNGAGEIDQSEIESGRAPECPILVFINSKSGGRLGPQLESLLVDLIAPSQVYDLSKCVPLDVLKYGLGHLEKCADAGDKTALETRNNLRITVAGGDGTIGWVLGTVAQVESKSHFTIPPVAVIPLGTGNDLSRSFRWGGATASISRNGVKKCLRRVMEAAPMTLDNWQVIVKPAPTQVEKPLKLPHAMAPQHHIPLGDSGEDVSEDKSPSFKGFFWNYFSLGLDAQVTYGFHNLRDKNPRIASGRIFNQMVYGGYSCVQGWFCTPCAAVPVARGLRQILKLYIKKPGDAGAQWEQLVVPAK